MVHFVHFTTSLVGGFKGFFETGMIPNHPESWGVRAGVTSRKPQISTSAYWWRPSTIQWLGAGYGGLWPMAIKKISPKQKHIEQMVSQEAAIRVSQPHGRKGLHIGHGEFGNTTDQGYCP